MSIDHFRMPSGGIGHNSPSASSGVAAPPPEHITSYMLGPAFNSYGINPHLILPPEADTVGRIVAYTPHLSSPQQELNPHPSLRTGELYPLSYGEAKSAGFVVSQRLIRLRRKPQRP